MLRVHFGSPSEALIDGFMLPTGSFAPVQLFTNTTYYCIDVTVSPPTLSASSIPVNLLPMTRVTAQIFDDGPETVNIASVLEQQNGMVLVLSQWSCPGGCCSYINVLSNVSIPQRKWGAIVRTRGPGMLCLPFGWFANDVLVRQSQYCSGFT
jgi:hypothetical protein